MAIKFVELSDEQLAAYEKQMATVHPDIVVWGTKAYGEISYRQFRADFFAGRLGGLGIPKPVAAKIEALKSLETPLVQHNIRMVKQRGIIWYRNNHFRMPGVELDDFIQEGCWAVMDCIYGFDGRNRFSTYIHFAIENRFKDYVRVDTPLSPIGPDILERVHQVTDYMTQHKVVFDEAVEALAFEPSQILGCRRAMAVVFSEAPKRNTEDEVLALADIAIQPEQPQYDEESPGMQAFRTANLRDLERVAFQGYLTDGKGYQTRIAEAWGLTRAAVSAAFVRAKQKIREQYEVLAPAEVQEMEENKTRAAA